jgi:hypothetical protein
LADGGVVVGAPGLMVSVRTFCCAWALLLPGSASSAIAGSITSERATSAAPRVPARIFMDGAVQARSGMAFGLS